MVLSLMRCQELTLAWMPGWDDTTQQLDYAHSFVKINQRAKGPLQITYHLQGAQPNSSHTVGVHVFACVLNFGQFMGDPCGFFQRDGNWSYATPVELGTITTDQNGNGNLEVNVIGLAPGKHTIDFHGRLGILDKNNLAACGSVPSPCYVIYKAPGPFGVGVIELTVE